jgi:hypothetical protein
MVCKKEKKLLALLAVIITKYNPKRLRQNDYCEEPVFCKLVDRRLCYSSARVDQAYIKKRLRRL